MGEPATDARVSTLSPGDWRGMLRDPKMVAFAAWAILLLVIMIRVGLRPHNQTVSKDFREAGTYWLHGENLYPRVGRFIYSPLAAALFAPFSLLPEGAAGIAWRLLVAAVFLGVTWTWFKDRLSAIGESLPAWGLLLMLPLSVGNLNNGQTNPLIIALLIGSVQAVSATRWNLATFCIVLATYIKVYPLALGLLLVVLYPRQMLWRLAAGLAIFGALSLVLQKPSYVIEQYQIWWRCLHADARHTKDGYGTWRDAWLLLHLAHVPITERAYVVLQLAAAATVAGVCAAGRAWAWSRDRLLLLALFLGVGWMIIFGPSTESATYLVLAPLVCLALAEVWAQSSSRGLRITIGAVYAALLIAEMGNSWLGSHMRGLHGRTVQPIAALVFVAFTGRWLIRAQPVLPVRPNPA